jgi:large subunit ribosomal protein L25
VPAIVYGGKAQELATVDPKVVLRMLHGHAGSTQLLTLRVDGEDGATRLAIIRALQFDPVSENLLHVDLQEVSPDKPITVRVAIHPTGEAIGVRDQKGILNLAVHDLEIACLPRDIPERVDADVSGLSIGDVLTVGDLTAPPGVRILNDPGQAVATVSPPMAEETPAPVATAAVTAEPEVLTERKPKEEEAAEDAKKGKK